MAITMKNGFVKMTGKDADLILTLSHASGLTPKQVFQKATQHLEQKLDAIEKLENAKKKRKKRETVFDLIGIDKDKPYVPFVREEDDLKRDW